MRKVINLQTAEVCEFHQWVVIGTNVFGLIETSDGILYMVSYYTLKFVNGK